MVDLDLLTDQLRKRGHVIESVIPVPANAGDFEFRIDGNMLTLDEVRALLAEDMGETTTLEHERAAAPDTDSSNKL